MTQYGGKAWRKVLSAGARIALNTDNLEAQCRAFDRLTRLTSFEVAYPIFAEYIQDKALLLKMNDALLMNMVMQYSPFLPMIRKDVPMVDWNMTYSNGTWGK